MAGFAARNILLTAALAGLVNLLPRLVAAPGADDVFMHYSLIDCFNHQLWQGDLYPRWCMEANAVGWGSPVFLFLFSFGLLYSGIVLPVAFVIGLTVAANIFARCWWLAGTVSF